MLAGNAGNIQNVLRFKSNMDSGMFLGVQMAAIAALNLPADWKAFQLPKALDERLQELLDRQDEARKLTARERREASALAKLADMLSLLKVRAAAAAKATNE